MFTQSRQSLLATVALCLVPAATVRAGEGCCDHCGCRCACQQVCRAVCEEKQVEVVCWGAKCEDFCLPRPGCPGCEHCERVCDPCQKATAEVCSKPRKFVWSEWFPCGARLFTKTKLMRRVEVKKIPSYKFVVEELCPACQAHCR